MFVIFGRISLFHHNVGGLAAGEGGGGARPGAIFHALPGGSPAGNQHVGQVTEEAAEEHADQDHAVVGRLPGIVGDLALCGPLRIVRNLQHAPNEVQVAQFHAFPSGSAQTPRRLDYDS